VPRPGQRPIGSPCRSPDSGRLRADLVAHPETWTHRATTTPTTVMPVGAAQAGERDVGDLHRYGWRARSICADRPDRWKSHPAGARFANSIDPIRDGPKSGLRAPIARSALAQAVRRVRTEATIVVPKRPATITSSMRHASRAHLRPASMRVTPYWQSRPAVGEGRILPRPRTFKQFGVTPWNGQDGTVWHGP